ncbi:MAG: signal peptidase I [Oscillospiraceae bacterium]|jgi:signal peptidase|nr:signal peptidase I [Oscillospiraceae bacterium]
MATYDTQGQEYAPWGPWGQQAPQAYPQAQVPWYTQPTRYDSQWQQPQQPWNTQQAWDAQQTWNTQQPWNAWQQNIGGQEIWSLPAEEEAMPEPIPEALLAKKQPSKAVNLVLNLLTFCVVAFVIVGSTVFAFSNDANKNLFGFRFYNVLTPSMQPLFKPGDMIFVKLTDPSNVKVGDVVTFNPSAKSTAFLTHRVAELLPAEEAKPARMVTKGDFNNAADPPVDLSAVIGVHVFTIPFMGRVVEMMRGNLLLVCICFGTGFLLLMVLRAYFAARKENGTKAL